MQMAAMQLTKHLNCSAVGAEGVSACSSCGSRRFGLVRHGWGGHQFCRKECMEGFKRRLNNEIWPRKFLVWLTGRPLTATKRSNTNRPH